MCGRMIHPLLSKVSQYPDGTCFVIKFVTFHDQKRNNIYNIFPNLFTNLNVMSF